MSIATQVGLSRDALTDSIAALRKAMTNNKVDLLRCEAALFGLGAGSEPTELFQAIAQAQRLVDQALLVNVAATACENELHILAALRAAGSQP